MYVRIAKSIRSAVIILLMGFTFKGVTAQKNGSSIRVLTRVGMDGVWLRWAPTDFTTWQLGIRYGYSIERYTLRADGTLESNEPVRLSGPGVKPLPEKEMENLSTSIEEVKIIQGLIYDKENDTSADSESPAALLKQHREANNRFGLALLVCDLSPRVAEAAGLFWDDKTAVRGARYIYRISLANSTAAVEPAAAVVDVKEEPSPQAFKDVKGTFGNRTVTLSWSILTHRGVYTAYLIEKSSDGKNFVSITELPYVPMSEVPQDDAHFVDSLSVNDTPFFYRVRGITPFGEKGPYSNVVSGIGLDNLSGLVVIRQVKGDDKNKVRIQWDFPQAYETKINGFVVEKAPKADGPYAVVASKGLTAKSREVLDNPAAFSSYYRIRAIDVKGNEITHSQPYFFHVEDTDPPAIPTGLTGRIDKNGVVSLRWRGNSDNDLMGYRVFSSNDLKHEFVEVTSRIMPASVYTDTINIKVLNKKIYYTVLAVDNNFNTSKFAAPIMLLRPDLIPPVAPVFAKVERKENGISLQWTNSISEDVVRYTLYRMVMDDTVKSKINDWPANKPQPSYQDDDLQQGKIYQYVLTVSDSSGNTSEVRSRQIKIEVENQPEVTELKALIDRDNKLIILKWEYGKAAKRCLLYRRKNNEPFTLYQTLEGFNKEFTDKLVTINNTYSYRIQLVFETNARTNLSQVLKVPF